MSAWVSRLPAPPALVPESLRVEPIREPAPAPPPGCTNAPPFYRLHLPSEGTPLFAMALGARRRALTVVSPSGVNDAGLNVDDDSATWIVEPDRAGVRFVRGPVEPGSNATLAASIDGAIVIAWSRAGADERADGSLRIAWFPHDGASPRTFDLARAIGPLLTDLVCTDARCALAYRYVDRWAAPGEDERAGFLRFVPGSAPFAMERTVASQHATAANAAWADGDAWAGTITNGTPRWWVRPGGAVTVLDSRVQEVAHVGDAWWAVTAEAPLATTRCQPGEWRMRLHRVGVEGAIDAGVAVATTDARPRGVRIRAIGAQHEPMVTWLDAPQCAERFFVVRAWRGGQQSAVATAEEYDVAVDGTRVSFVTRVGPRIRWFDAQCP